jgi:hypothetical protein
MAAIEVKFFNSFVLRKTLGTNDLPMWNGSRGDNTFPQPNSDDTSNFNWVIEESRIRGGYNNTQSSLGAKAYLVEDQPNSSVRINSMIYSGIFNSRTGINDTNVFSVADDIVKSVDPVNGSIQRLYAEDTSLIIFQQSKVSRAPIDKDLIYSAEGTPTLATSNLVIGSISPFSGNYGISNNPESFAVYGNRKYFTDKDRNAVLRLSQDGLTEISNYGMIDFFRDELSALNTSSFNTGKSIGGWDMYSKQYILSLQRFSVTTPQPYKTLSFDDAINGWTSLYTYKPDQMLSVKSDFFSLKDGSIYKHYSQIPNTRSRFYGEDNRSSIKFIFNPKVSMSKVFKTINYEGSNGWEVTSFNSDTTGVASVGQPQLVSEPSSINTYTDTTTAPNYKTISVLSYNQGSYDNFGHEYPTALVPPINHAGFDRKENKYVANLVNTSTANAGEVIWGNDMTGIKAFYSTVIMQTDSGTDVGGMKELFAVSSDYVESSY